MIDTTTLPDDKVLTKAQSAIMLGVSPTHIGTLIRTDKLVPDEEDPVGFMVSTLRTYHDSKGAKVGAKKKDGRIYHVRLNEEQVAALREADYDVVDPREAQKRRDEANMKKAAADLKKLEEEMAREAQGQQAASRPSTKK
jgi:hypothetical protein